MFVEFARTKSRTIRNELVRAHLGFATHVASRYFGRGPADDDLKQVAFLALIKSVERFDPTYGVAFTSFAGRTIEGELKRHFRDTTWSLRVPRSAQELHLRVRRANDELSSKLNRSPTVPEVARYLEVTTDEVIDAMAAGAAYTAASLEAPIAHDTTGGDGDSDHHQSVGRCDPHFDLSEDQMLIADLVETLDPRSQYIVRVRFFEQRTQSEIAEELGISQVHVSRLLRRALEDMRARAGKDERIGFERRV